MKTPREWLSERPSGICGGSLRGQSEWLRVVHPPLRGFLFDQPVQHSRPVAAVFERQEVLFPVFIGERDDPFLKLLQPVAKRAGVVAHVVWMGLESR